MKTHINTSLLAQQSELALKQNISGFTEALEGADNTVLFINTPQAEYVVKCGEEVEIDTYVLTIRT